MINIKGEKTVLRAVEPGDIEQIYKWENSSEHWEISSTKVPQSLANIEDYVYESSKYDIYTTKQLKLVVESLAGAKIGCIDLFDFDPLNRRLGIGIIVEKGERRKGVALDALNALTNFCFEQLLLKQVYCNVLKENKASLKLFAKVGFKKVGLKKAWTASNKGWKDEYLLQLINS